MSIWSGCSQYKLTNSHHPYAAHLPNFSIFTRLGKHSLQTSTKPGIFLSACPLTSPIGPMTLQSTLFIFSIVFLD